MSIDKSAERISFCKTMRTTLVVVMYIDQLSQCRLIIVGNFFLDTLAICISPLLISSLLFAFRFPVIHFENFCLAVNHLGS